MALEKNDILAAIHDAGGNISKAARRLGVARRTLQARMRSHGIPKGQAGRRKRKISYSRASKGYAVGIAAVAAVVGGVALYRRKGSSA